MIENGEVTWKTASGTGDWYMDRNGADIVMFRTDGTSSIMVDQQDYIKVSDGINLVFYDNLLGSVIHAVGFSPSEDGYICVK